MNLNDIANDFVNQPVFLIYPSAPIATKAIFQLFWLSHALK
jgi:hypothetical protein